MTAETRKYLDAFAKLLAPAPHIYVFADLVGLWYDATEDPRSHQVMIGVSREMFWRIENDCRERTGRGLPGHIAVTHLPTRFAVIPSRASLEEGVVEITLTPKLIEESRGRA